MTERRSQAVGIGRRLRRFALIVIWAVPLTYFSTYIDVLTDGSAKGLKEEKFGTAVVERCYPDGPLGMHFWHACEVQVRWDDGGQGQRIVRPPDLEPVDVGTHVRVVYLAARGNEAQVRVDEDRPWWWVWWLTGAPALALAALLVLIGVFTLVQGTRFDPARNRPPRPRRLRS